MKYIGSYHQERIWFIDAFERGSLYDNGPVYHNIPLILHVKDGLDSEIVRKVLDFLSKENEILRTEMVTVDNVVYQEVHEEEIIPLQILTIEEELSTEKAVEQLIQMNNCAFADGIEGVLCKAVILKGTGQDSFLLITFHHSICDETSKQLFKKEFISVYEQLENGEEPVLCLNEDEDELDLDELMSEFFEMNASEEVETEQEENENLSYKEYAKQQKEISDEVLEREVMHWKGHLHERIQALEIPTDEKRAAIHIYDPAVEMRSLSKDFVEKLSLFSERYGITHKGFFLAVFKLLLMKYSQLEEINIGTSISDQRASELKHTLGPISNLVLLSDEFTDNQSFLEIATQAEKTYEAAREHSIIPFDKLVMEINPENDMSRTALFDVLFNYCEECQDERFEELDYNLGWGKYDYNLLVKEAENEVRMIMTYNRLYFKKESIERLLANMETLCEWVLANPKESVSHANYISDAEKEYLINGWNEGDHTKKADVCIHQMFEEMVKKHGDRIAVKDDNNEITYKELNQRANQVANYLAKKGITIDDKVALILDKDIDCIAIILGILKAGAAYIPVDKSLPEERVTFMLEDCKAKVCFAKESYQHIAGGYENLVSLQEALESFGLESKEFVSVYKPASLAYIIYTSGTTGKPKGVLLEHHNVTTLIRDNASLFDFSENDVWTMFHSYNFDFSVWEMYGCLLNGGKLILISNEIARDVKKYHEILIKEEVTILNQTPSAFYMLDKEECEHAEKNMSVRMIIYGGEALNTAKLAKWKERYPKVTFINMYGITETTIHVTYKKLTDDIIEKGENTIGKPLLTYKGYVMDQYQQIVPMGVKGELVVGGSGVGRGYLNLLEMTEKKFIEDPYKKGERLYRSGDLVRIKHNGELEYLGRIDKQVQIRGFRIEIGEIETTLFCHNDIDEACIIARDNGMGSLELVAYLVIKEGVNLNYNVLSNYLKNTLPEYMVPSKFIKVNQIPITGNGKVDSKKLLETKGESLDAGGEFVEATTELEKELVEIWKKTIEVEKIGIYDNYFHLGGNSILVTKLMFLINERYGMEIPYRYFFTKPTIKDLEDYIVENQSEEAANFMSQIDWEAEMALPLDIPENVPYAQENKKVLLTGATGFLGAFLLKSLLETTDSSLYCLVKAEDEKSGMDRIISNLAYYNLGVLSGLDRVKVVVGDLALEKLGLSIEDYHMLAEEVDEIYHNAALALYAFSYEQLKPVNVLGTAEIIGLAAQCKRKAIHYISTVSVFDGTTKKEIMEDDIPDYGNMRNQGGYGMTKLVSEALLRRAREKGLKVNIYRPGRIAGSSKDGACQSKDFLWMLIRACIEVNGFMGQTVPTEMVSVDLLADAIVHIARTDTECGHNLNLNREQDISGEKLRNWLVDCGYKISMDEYGEWYQKVVQKAKRDQNSVCAQLMPLLPSGSGEAFVVRFDYSQANKFYDIDQKFYVKEIETIFKNTIRFFQEKGIIEAPGRIEDVYGFDVLATEFLEDFE